MDIWINSQTLSAVKDPDSGIFGIRYLVTADRVYRPLSGFGVKLVTLPFLHRFITDEKIFKGFLLPEAIQKFHSLVLPEHLPFHSLFHCFHWYAGAFYEPHL